MVLNKSKWDHKAKIQYLKKHNLTKPKQGPEIRPKWSGKKTAQNSEIAWLDQHDDSDAEWGSEDEAILNHFYPQVAEDNLAVEHKRKLKRQIIQTVRKTAVVPHQTDEPEQPDYSDGIYLGQRPEQSHELEPPQISGDEDELFIPDLDTKLSEFLDSGLARSKNRKMLTSNMSDDLLEDYGLESYSQTVKDHDYNATSQKVATIDLLSADDLHGLRIGGAANEVPSKLRLLSEEEKAEHAERAKKAAHAKFHSQIKKKFGPQTGARVQEINNFNSKDERQMEALTRRLLKTNETPVDITSDLDELLGVSQPLPPQKPDEFPELDLLLSSLPSKANEDLPAAKPKATSTRTDQFLDDLLGL